MLVLKLCEQYCPEKIPVTPTIRLGDGADGEVFEIAGDPDKVIKFCILYDTGSVGLKNTYKYISNVIDHLIVQPSPTYAQVYVHSYMGEFSREVAWGKKIQKYILYYYTMEKLFKTTEDERKVFHTILSHEDRNIVKNYTTDEIRKMLEGLSRGLDFDAERVTFFCDNFRKTPVSHYDIHVRNIMKDAQGNFKLIDFDRAQLQRGD